MRTEINPLHWRPHPTDWRGRFKLVRGRPRATLRNSVGRTISFSSKQKALERAETLNKQFDGTPGRYEITGSFFLTFEGACAFARQHGAVKLYDHVEQTFVRADLDVLVASLAETLALNPLDVTPLTTGAPVRAVLDGIKKRIAELRKAGRPLSYAVSHARQEWATKVLQEWLTV